MSSAYLAICGAKWFLAMETDSTEDGPSVTGSETEISEPSKSKGSKISIKKDALAFNEKLSKRGVVRLDCVWKALSNV